VNHAGRKSIRWDGIGAAMAVSDPDGTNIGDGRQESLIPFLGGEGEAVRVLLPSGGRMR
jgi:hypothetical protein